MAQIKLTPHSDRLAEIRVNERLDAVILQMPEKVSPSCYQTDERYFCSGKCQWSHGCKTLTAAWLRRD